MLTRVRRRAGAALAAVLIAGCSGNQPAPAPARAGASGQVLHSVQLGERPLAPSAAGRSVWVPNSGEGTLAQVDGGTGRLLRTIRIGSTRAMLDQGCAPTSEHAYYSGSFLFRLCDLPSAVRAVDGAVWVAKNDTRAVERLDPAEGRPVAEIPIGRGIWDLAASPEMVWTTDYLTDSAVRIDPATNRVVAALTGLPHGPTGIAIGSGAVWIVTSSGGGHLVRVDPATNQVVAVIDVGANPMGVVVAFGSVWVQNESGATVTRVDAATNRVLATIPVGPREGREGLDSLVEFGGGVWLGGSRIQMIDPASNSVTRTLHSDAVAIAAGSGAIWATTILGRLLKIDPNRA